MSGKSRLFAAMIAVAGVAGAGATFAADPPSSAPTVAAPATGPTVEAMKIFVAEVKGLVQVRTAENQPWKPAKTGMELTQGAEFRTGPRSSVTCQIPPDQILVLDRLGTVRIDEAIRTGQKVKTDMIMKYGRTRYDIEAAGAEHESTIRSPSSTLAVRGTSVSLYDQPPFAPAAESFHGRAAFRDAQRELKFGGTSFTRIASDKKSVAETALAKSVVDPVSAASRTRSDSRYVADQTSKSAFLFSFDAVAQIPVIRDGPSPPTDAQLLASVPNLPGTLDIVLRWTGNADINLEVANLSGKNPIFLLQEFQKKPGEFLYPGYGLNHGSAGGTIPYDNQGGRNGGMEIAYWKGNYPQGLYGFAAQHISGGPALVTFNVFLNGEALDNLTTFQVDSTGNPVLDPVGGFPTLIKNSQITRPVNAPSKALAVFGPDTGLATITQFIPTVPALDDLPVEPPVTFPDPSTLRSAKGRTHAPGTSTVRLSAAPRPVTDQTVNSRQFPRGR